MCILQKRGMDRATESNTGRALARIHRRLWDQANLDGSQPHRIPNVPSSPSRIRGFTKFLGVVFALAFVGSSVQAVQSVSLAWDPSADPSVVGYFRYYGTTTGNYTNQVNVANVTSTTIPGLVAGATYFFAVTAYDAAGLESGPSAEIRYTVPSSNNPPTIALTSPANGGSYTAPAPINLAASVTANGHAISSVQFYNGASLLGTATSAPYTFVWNKVSAGSYGLTARAVYDVGSTAPCPCFPHARSL